MSGIINVVYFIGDTLSPNILLTLIVSFMCMLYIIDRYRKSSPKRRFAATIPGPFLTLPIIGNSWIFAIDNYTTLFLKYEKKYGPKYRLWLGNHLAVVLTDIADLEVVFGSSNMLDRPLELWKPFEKLFGLNISNAPKPIWKKCRRELQPFLSRNHLAKSIDDINRIICKYVNKMEKLVDGKTFDIVDYILHDMMFDIFTRTIFGFELEEQEDIHKNVQFRGAFVYFDNAVNNQTLKPWEQIKFIEYLKHRQQLQKFRKQTSKLVQLVMACTCIESPSEISETSEIGKVGMSFLQSIKQLQKDLNLGPEYIRNEIKMFVGGGTDASAITLGAVLVMIAMHSKIQDKVYEELQQRFGDDQRLAEINDIQYLPYLDQVMKETQRYFMSEFLIFRHVEQSSKIGPYVYPAGTAIIVPVTNIHWNPRYYPNPLEFNPENFNSENVNKRPRMAFIPLGAGPRNCIGKSLAEIEIKLALIAFLRKFNFSTTMKIERLKDKLTPQLVLDGNEGLYVNIELRNNKFS